MTDKTSVSTDKSRNERTRAQDRGQRSTANWGPIAEFQESGVEPILMGAKSTIDPDTIKLPESYAEEKSGAVGTTIFVIAILLAIGGIGYILANDSLREQTGAFLSGNIREYKEKEKKRIEAEDARIQAETRNRYGNVTLSYFPQDARVIITELKWVETLPQFVSRSLKGGDDTRGEPQKREIPNRTGELKENEKVDSLPLMDLPIMQKAEGKDDQIETFAYEVTIEKEGYYPRMFLFADETYPGKKDEKTALIQWVNAGPGIYMAQWNGCDLMPKPELMRKQYAKVIVGFECLKKTPDGKKLTEEELNVALTEMKRNNGFMTDERWAEVEKALKENAAMWPEIEKEIKETPCEAPQ